VLPVTLFSNLCRTKRENLQRDFLKITARQILIFFKSRNRSLPFLSFACPKERKKPACRQAGKRAAKSPARAGLRWIWHPHAQVAELLALLFTMTVTFFLNVSSFLLRESF